jgi:hypothetical protein
MKIEMDSKIEHREFTKRETGEVFKFSEQQAYLHVEGERYPLPFALSLPDGHQGYAPGFYRIGLSSFQIEKNRLTLKRNLDLEPIEGQKAKVA